MRLYIEGTTTRGRIRICALLAIALTQLGNWGQCIVESPRKIGVGDTSREQMLGEALQLHQQEYYREAADIYARMLEVSLLPQRCL